VSEQQNPAPLVAADVDLTDFPYMPLDVRRLRDSGLASKVSGDAFRAAVLLWCASWHQVPAASLPDDDEELASLAGYGFGSGVRDWRKIRVGALRGWVKCSDGRLYHGVVAEKANEAWTSKLQHRHRRECERLKKMGQRLDVKPVYPSFEEWVEYRERTGSDRWPDPKCPEGQASHVPGDIPNESRGTGPARPEDVPTPVPGDSVSKGEGEGKGERRERETPSLRSGASREPARESPEPTLSGQACRLMREAGVQRVNPSDPKLAQLLLQGVTPQQLGDLARELRETKPDAHQPYVLAAMQGRLRDAAAMPQHPPGTAQRAGQRPGSAFGDEIDRISAAIDGRTKPAKPEPVTIEVEARRVG
jgi:hypothetical protein